MTSGQPTPPAVDLDGFFEAIRCSECGFFVEPERILYRSRWGAICAGCAGPDIELLDREAG